MDKMEQLLSVFIEDLHHRNIPCGLKHIQTRAKELFNNIKNNMKDKTAKEIEETFSASKG